VTVVKKLAKWLSRSYTENDESSDMVGRAAMPSRESAHRRPLTRSADGFLTSRRYVHPPCGTIGIRAFASIACRRWVLCIGIIPHAPERAWAARNAAAGGCVGRYHDEGKVAACVNKRAGGSGTSRPRVGGLYVVTLAWDFVRQEQAGRAARLCIERLNSPGASSSGFLRASAFKNSGHEGLAPARRRPPRTRPVRVQWATTRFKQPRSVPLPGRAAMEPSCSS
jgi:hypothetical protein